jgi:D-3-phosphoglycerate dehydrogenase
MSRSKVVVTDHVFPSLEIEHALLDPISEIVALQASSDTELLDVVGDADALLVCYAPVTRRVIERLTQCRVIARYGIGVDNVDLAAATAKRIPVTNVPDYCVDEVSDHALALLLACARKISLLDRRVRSGRWEARDAAPMHRLQGSVLGLIGFGKIPRRLTEKGRALGLHVIAFDPFVGEDEMRASHAEKVALPALLARADFVSVHAPLVPETRGMVAEAELRAMKPTAYLINTSRGPLVSHDALVKALREGWIAGAALDVVEREPPPDIEALRDIEALILTPHVAFYSEESVRELQRKAVENVVRALSNEPLRYVVSPAPPASG